MENKTLVEKSISSLSHSVMCKNCKSTKYFKHVCHFIPTRAKYKGRSRERYIFGCCRKSSFPHHCLGLHLLGRSLLAPCWSWSQEEFSYVVGIIRHCIWWGFRGGSKMMTMKKSQNNFIEVRGLWLFFTWSLSNLALSQVSILPCQVSLCSTLPPASRTLDVNININVNINLKVNNENENDST